jgi:hypothetical protein
MKVYKPNDLGKLNLGRVCICFGFGMCKVVLDHGMVNNMTFKVEVPLKFSIFPGEL